MGRGSSGGGSRGGGFSGGGSRGGSFRSSSGGGRGRSSSSFSRGSYHSSYGGGFHSPYHSTRVYVGGSYGLNNTFISCIVVLLVAFVTFAYAAVMLNRGGITRSTIDREPLPKQYVTDTGYWIDDSDMDWIRSDAKVEAGLREFYDRTGVMPYLVVVSQVNNSYHPSGQEVFDFAGQIYDQMFTDEGHMVFVLQCQDGSTDYTMAAVTGVMAKTVIDDEALEILYDYMDSNFYSDKSEDDMFADTFRSAAKRIMMKTPNYLALVGIGFLIVSGLIILFFILKSVFKRQKEKAKERQRILETPVQHIPRPDVAEDLADKYEE